MTHITSGGSYYGAGGSAGGSAPQRRVPRVHCIHRITSAVHFDLRYISTAGDGGRRRATAGCLGWRRRGRPSLFLLYKYDVREIYPLYYYPVSIPIYTQSLELSFSNLQFMVRTRPMQSTVFARVWVYSSVIYHSIRFAGPFLRW